MAKRKRDVDEDSAAGAVAAEASAAFESEALPVRLSRTQLKNRSKRLRAKRPCHRCGKPGHQKRNCSAASEQQQAGQSDAAADSEDAVQCLGCRRFGHRLTHCTHLRQPHKSTLTAAEQLAQSGEEAHGAANNAGERVVGSGTEQPGQAARGGAEAEEEQPVVPLGSQSALARPARLCYHCGGVSHTAGQCVDGGARWAFAVCFVCGQTGHLSRDCASNEHGVFVRGGACHRCGSKQHKAKHCTEPSAVDAAAGAAEESAAEQAAPVSQRLSMQQLGLSSIASQSRTSKRGRTRSTASATPALAVDKTALNRTDGASE